MDLAAEVASLGERAFTARGYRPGTVEHVVLLRFRDDVDEASRSEAVRRFRALAGTPHPDGRLRYVESVTAGPQRSGEGHGHGFEVGVVVRFSSEGDRNHYVGEPFVRDPALYDAAHHEFKAFLGPLLAEGPQGLLVFDVGRP